MIADYDVFQLNKKEKCLLFAALTAALALLGEIFYKCIFTAVISILIYRPAEKIYCSYRAKARKDMMILRFRDLLFSLSSSFAAGRHMGEALTEAKTALGEIYQGDSIIAPEIENMIKRMTETGATDIEVWEDLSARSRAEDIEDFTQIFRACRETGGDFVTAANKAARVIAEKINIETEIKTMAAQKKLEGRIITVMPVAIIIFLRATSPDYLDIMYSTLAGRILMSAALAAITAAYFIIERITKIEV